MALRNTRNAYGSAAIALHWISAIGVVALYVLGERMEAAADRTAKVAAQDLHVSVAVLLFTFLAARLLWSASQPKPTSFERNRYLQLAARTVHGLFLMMIAILLITGPLAIWSTGRPIEAFNLFAIPSPFGARLEGLHEATETIHGAATKLFWPLIVLHVGGALKHLIVDRDGTVRRMLWARGG
jgi:cytochrome b561